MDTPGNLPDRCCYVCQDGKFYAGKLAVWRSPLVSPTDIEVWEARVPPAFSLIPNNSVVCSINGAGVTSLSGGDYDGDEIAYSADKHLLEILSLSGDGAGNPYVSGAKEVTGDLMTEARLLYGGGVARVLSKRHQRSCIVVSTTACDR